MTSVIPGLEKGYLRKGGKRGKEKGTVERRLTSRVSDETVFGFFVLTQGIVGSLNMSNRKPTIYTAPYGAHIGAQKRVSRKREALFHLLSVCTVAPLPLELAFSIVTWVSVPSSSPPEREEFI